MKKTYLTAIVKLNDYRKVFAKVCHPELDSGTKRS